MLMVIMRGVPGSGKSYAASRIARDNNMIVCSTDDYFMVDGEYRFDPKKLGEYHNLNFKRVEALVQKGKKVVVDNTNTKLWEFEKYITLARNYGYEVIIIEPNTPWCRDAKECAVRNSHGVPEAVIHGMLDRWEEIK